MNCREALPRLHDYLDDRLAASDCRELKDHLADCPDCSRRLDQLEQTDVYMRMLPEPGISEGFTGRVMAALPKPAAGAQFKRFIQRHPAISVAVVFIMVMMSSFFSLWDKETNLVLKGSDLDDIVIEGNTVIVPAGKVVNGDLTVENGMLRVDGIVQGNLVVVDGTFNLASTASIAGQVTSVDQTIDYFWFKVKEFFSGFSR